MKHSLDRKMDRILERENSGRIKKGIRNRALRKLFANRLSVLGFIIFIVILVMCLGAPLFTQYSATKVDLRNILSPPTSSHIFGTDKIGRDIWARILYGGRISIGVGLGSALVATVLGVSLGTMAGYKGGWFDGIIMKVSEILMSFPQIILVLILVTITGQSLWNLIFIFSITGWPSMYRMARSQMLSLREEEYVQALKAFGIGSMRIAFVHMLPNAIGPIFVNITLSTAMFILQEASLSFLGIGIQPPTPSWGNMISAAQTFISYRPVYSIMPGVAIMITVIAFNIFGDGLRDALDPKLRS